MQGKAHRKPRSGFTLAELLVTIAIIGIVFAVALPALTNLTGQSKLEGAANAVHSAAKMARQYAIAHGQPTYLVFHDAQTTSDDHLAYRSYAVFTINIHTNPVTQTAGSYLGEWETLPSGIVFDPDINLADNLFNAGGTTWEGGLDHYNELRIGNNTHVVFGFKPDGEAASESRHIHLAAGMVADGQPTVFVPGQGKQIHFTILGKSRIVDYVYDENGGFRMLGGE